MGQGGTEGGRSEALSEQQAGERDTSPFQAPVAPTPELQGVFGNFPSYQGPPPTSLPADTTFQMLPGTEAGGMSIMPSETGAGASVGAGGGAGALAAPLIGVLTNLASKGLKLDPETGAIVNAVGQVVAPTLGAAIAGGIAGGIGGGAAGAAGGAAAGAAAGAAGSLITAPVALPTLAASLDAAFSKMGAMERAGRQMQRLAPSIPGHVAEWNKAPELLRQLNTATPEEAKGIYDQLRAIQKSFQDTGMEQFLMQGGTASMYGPGAGLNFDQGPAIQESLRPQMSAYDVGLLRAIDKMAKGGMDISGTSYPTPEAAASAFGANASYRDPESGSRARGIQYNPYLAENYAPAYAQTNRAALMAQGIDPDKYGTGQLQGAPYGMEQPFRSQETPWFLGGPEGTSRWSPQAQADFASIQPGEYEAGLARLFGGQYMNPNFPELGFGTGQMQVGGMPGDQVGGAGKRSPQFITPELDNREQAGTGRLAGRPGASPEGGQPFGLSGRRGGGMQVGGGPRGNAPFGGMARQTMMPSAGGGVQAQHKNQAGVV